MTRWTVTEVEECIVPLRRYALVLTRQPVAADELVQETLLRAYERTATFRAGAPLKPWLLAILHNLHLSHRRRDAAEARAFAEIARQDEASTDPQQIEQTLLLREVAERFRALPEAQRAVMHLIVVEGLSYREAADALAVPVGTIMSRLSRARATLREPTPAVDDRHPLRLIGGTDAS